MTIEEILKKRTNITFLEDKIPEKKVIDDILKKHTI